ncbi:MAG: TrmJ/YjtD family RNA methyltransferase [Xanthobacteraceae bacterium]|jgi:tRNA/rRNA methyltransferase
MPGAGTDKTKNWVAQPGPIVVLVEPQLGENIGAAARAMANFGLSQMRLVKPRQGWPNEKAHVMAAGADRVLEAAVLYDTAAAAVADCNLVFAATARAHDQAKPVVGPEEAVRLMAAAVGAGQNVAILFGRERYGLEGHEVGLADRIVTFPINPAFASLNLSQAVLVMSYEWFKLAGAGLPFAMPQKSPQATKQQLLAFFANLERELDKVEFFRPPEKRAGMLLNLHNIFHRMEPTQQDIQTLHGVILAIADGRKGPARGGLLDSDEALMLRALLAEHDKGKGSGAGGAVRGLSRLLRRNPTDTERTLWDKLTKDRRFSGHDFKRQTPIGPHVADLVSFRQRLVVELVPPDETEAAKKSRAERHAWLTERKYSVMELSTADTEANLGQALDRIAAALSPSEF